MSELAWPEPDIGTSGTWRKKAVVLLYAPRSRDAEPFEWSLEYSSSEEQSRGEEKETPAVAEARDTMRSLSVDELGASGLTQGVQDRVLEFLDATTTEASTFPSIVPDDDGVAVLHWVAGERSLQVDVEESGPTYLWAKEPGHEAVVLTEAIAITVCARINVRRIAEDVSAVNPAWRERMRRL